MSPSESPPKTLRSPFDLWMAGLQIGATTVLKEPVLGLKRLILPVSYWRTAEFAYTGRQLTAARGARVFDLGSPKDFAAMLARKRGYEVVAADILPEAIDLSDRYARAQGLAGDGPGRVRSEIQDGRALAYPDNFFDASFSVSVLEHIPDDGDSLAIRELVRITKPGGRIVVTVPYAPTYRETFVDEAVYEREQRGGEPVFFERHYDDAGLRNRLILPSGAELENLEKWGEGRLRVERLLKRLGGADVLALPLHPLLSSIALRPIVDSSGHPMAAFLTLRKGRDA